MGKRSIYFDKQCKILPSIYFIPLLPFLSAAGHTDYMQHTRPLSPWRVIDGWHLGTVFHDPMHVLYLGICKDLYASALGYWIRQGYYGEGTLSDKLRCFSSELKRASKQQRSFQFEIYVFF